MKAKLLLWMFALIFLSSLASANLNDGLVAYYKSDTNGTYPDYFGVNDGTITGATFTASGKINGSYDYESGSSSNRIVLPSLIPVGNKTVSLWFKAESLAASNHYIIEQSNTSYVSGSAFGFVTVGTTLAFYGYDTGDFNIATITTGQWYHIVATYNGTTMITYLNGTNVANKTHTYATRAANTTLGVRLPYLTEWFDGVIDEVAIYNRFMEPSEVQQLYNNYTGLQPPFGDATNFTITATDEFNGTAIQQFSAFADQWYHTTNGTITTSLLSNATTRYNITLNASNYLNRTYTNYNISSNLAAQLHQAELCLNSTAKVSGLSVTGVTYYIGSTSSTSCFNVTAATHSVVAAKTGWYNQTQSFTLSALQQLNSTVQNMSYANLTIYVRKANGGTYLTGYDLNISSLNYTSWQGENQTSVTNYSWYLINNTYSVTVRKTGYAINNATVNVTVAGATNYTFYLYEENTLNISVYNEQTNTLLSGINVTIDIIQTNQTSNYTTDNGTLYVTSLTPGEVEIRYADVPGTYRGRVYIVTLANLTYQEIRLYLLNTSLGSLITLDMVDQDGQDVEGGIIKAQRFYPSENLYRTIAMTRTNFNGQGSIDLVKKTTQSNIFYKFIVEIDGAVKEETDALEINPLATDILYFTINVLEDIFISWDGANTGIVSGELTFSATTNQFSFVWNDPTNLVREGCLQVRRIKPLTETEICNTCTVSASATLLCNVTNTGDLYRAEALLETNTNNSLYTVDVLDYSYGTKSGTFGLFGVFLAVLFIGTFAMVGLWNPIVAIVLATVATVFCAILGMVHMTYVTVVTIVILAGVIIAKSRT